MKEPPFWYRAGGQSFYLRLLSKIFRKPHLWALAFRARTLKPQRFSKPVICVGNTTVGGVGKTPLVRWMARFYRAQGLNVAVILRGYGGTVKAPTLVDPKRHTAADVGDEALLHAKDGPTWIARVRAEAVQAAFNAGADAVLMDDGLQTASLTPSAALLVIDGLYGLGNGELVPFGPLREPLETALLKVQAVVIMGRDVAGITDQIKTTHPSIPIFHAARTLKKDKPLPKGPLYAFAGIGRPERFFAFLRERDAELVAEDVFPNHHTYQASDIQEILRAAGRLKAQPVTTEKDWARLSPEQRTHIIPIPMRLDIAPRGVFEAFLMGRALCTTL